MGKIYMKVVEKNTVTAVATSKNICMYRNIILENKRNKNIMTN